MANVKAFVAKVPMSVWALLVTLAIVLINAYAPSPAIAAGADMVLIAVASYYGVDTQAARVLADGEQTQGTARTVRLVGGTIGEAKPAPVQKRSKFKRWLLG